MKKSFTKNEYDAVLEEIASKLLQLKTKEISKITAGSRELQFNYGKDIFKKFINL
jgi:hypothetical protein